MTNFDPTTNRIPFGLLTPKEQKALKKWPHGWQVFGGDDWADRHEPMWVSRNVYRGKPAPVVEVLFGAAYSSGFSLVYESIEEALDDSTDRRIGFIRAEIVEGKLKDVRVVKGDET